MCVHCLEEYLARGKYYVVVVSQFSHSVVSNSWWPHGLQHSRLPCSSPTPGVCSDSCPLSQWCHPTISCSVLFTLHDGHDVILQLSSVAQSCPTLCNLRDCSTPGFPVHHQLPEPAQIHVHWVGDASQPSHPLSSPSPAFNLSQHQGLFKWVSSLHQVAKGLELQLQHQSFQWLFRTDLL